MVPVFLSRPLHDEERPGLERYLDRFEILPSSVAKEKISGRAKTERSNTGSFPQFRFVVTVPTHRISTVTIEIPENGIEFKILTNQS